MSGQHGGTSPSRNNQRRSIASCECAASPLWYAKHPHQMHKESMQAMEAISEVISLWSTGNSDPASRSSALRTQTICGPKPRAGRSMSFAKRSSSSIIA